MNRKSTVFLFISIFVTAEATDCHSGWVAFHDSCYLFSHDKEPWMIAQLVCQGFGGHLTEIDTAEEDAFLEHQVQLHTDVWFWIGLTDLELEGDWHWWSDKRKPTFLNWGPGEPNNGGEENCVHIKKEPNGKTAWNDYLCSGLSNYICEIENESPEVVG